MEAEALKIGLSNETSTVTGTITVSLSAKVNRPLAYAGVILKMAGDWLLDRAVKVKVSGA